MLEVHPKMVYFTTINQGEVKGPHLHITRHYYFLCIKGKVIFIIRDPSGKYHEIESSDEKPVLIEVPKNFASSHINLSKETSIILALANPAWHQDDKDENNVTFDDYDWKKWEIDIQETNDHRSYFASFEKIENLLGFTTDYGIKYGAREIYQALEDGDIHADIKTKTVEWYKYLLNNPEAAKNFMINNTLL